MIIYLFLSPGHTFASDKSCMSEDNLACHLEIISRIEVQIHGDLLEKYKNNFLNLIKKSSKNCLPMLTFEDYPPDLIDYTGCDHEETKKRGALYCSITTAGRHATAFHVLIELYGFGNFRHKQDDLCINPPFPRFKAYYPVNKNYFKGEILGVTKYNQAREKISQSIKKIIAQISFQVLEARGKK